MSVFIAFEGGEGSGKSTQARLLSKAFDALGVPHILTREPGDTELGQHLRRILLDRNTTLHQRTEALLFAADRAEHVATVIKPALEQGKVVVCDRYIGSSVAYQAYAGGLSPQMILLLSQWATYDLLPDATFLMDIDPAVGLARARKTEQTRFEDKDVDYHTRVRRGFYRQMDGSWFHMDGKAPVDILHQTILEFSMKLYRDKVGEG